MNETRKRDDKNKPETAPSLTAQTLYANLIFYAFLGLVCFLTYLACGRIWDDVISDTVRYLFLALGGGFSLVSVLNVLYEKYYGNPEEGGR
jgi:hypothetical protein